MFVYILGRLLLGLDGQACVGCLYVEKYVQLEGQSAERLYDIGESNPVSASGL